MKKMTWALALGAGTIVWAILMDAAIGTDAGNTWTNRLGTALGMGGPVYIGTGLVAGLAYIITKKVNIMMWIWTVTLLVVLVALGIGGVKVASI